MAIFSNNNNTYDSKLRRKRSTSTPRDRPSRPSVDEKSADVASLHKCSPTHSASPSFSVVITPEPHEPAPPLPTPVTAELGFRLRTVLSSGSHNTSASSYDQSSTPIPFTKPPKRASPPPFSSLMIDVPSPNPAVDPGQSLLPRATVMHPDTRSTSSNPTSSSSSPAVYPIPNFSPGNVPIQPERLSLDSPSALAHNAETSGSISPSMVHVEGQRSVFSQRMASVLPLKLPYSPTRKRNSETGTIALPTPISPPHGRRTAEPIPIPPATPLARPQSRSQSAKNSPTAYTPGSAPGSANSSARHVPPSMVNQDVAGATSGPGSASASGQSTPTHDAANNKPREKRTHNVLRKRSITTGSRRHEPESAPASDSEKRTNNTHRPRSRSVVFSSSSRRDSNGPGLDISQPLPPKPVTVIDLTPAKEILAAYKESHRDSFPPDTPLPSSGIVVAIGSEEDASFPKSPRSSGLQSRRKDEGSKGERDVGESSGTGGRSLRRKLSGKWIGKGPSKRRDEPMRSVSGSAVEVSERKLNRDMEAKRSTTFPNDTQVNTSPTTSRSPERGRPLDRDGGCVKDGNTGNWVGKHLRDADTEEKDGSNSRRLWKLVKRLSSGNLREKSGSVLEPPPPVPPMPKILVRDQRDIGPSEADGFHSGEMPIPQSAVPETLGGIRRYISSVPSLSIPRPKTTSGLDAKQTSAHHRFEPEPGVSPHPAPSPPRTSVIHRSITTSTAPQMLRSATTRSSSRSSETTKFFSRSRSSSSTSYGDAMAPPMPSIGHAHVDKHTASPREHHSGHHEKGEDDVDMERRVFAKPSTPSSTRTSDETSPIIPSFKANHPTNKFLPYNGRRPSLPPSPTSDHEPVALLMEQAKGAYPPPIPKRNPRRPGHHSMSIPSLPLPVDQHSMPNVIPVQDSSESEATDGDAHRSKRRLDSRQTPTISKARPRSISDGAIIPEPERYASTAKSILTFREMTTAQRQLTEQEKNAKWEDLLQRSDKAGGTLHVGSPITGGLGLWSDRSSVALSETLDSTD